MVEETRAVVNMCLRRGNSPFLPYCGYMRESQYSLWASTQHANNWSFNQATAPEVSFARECVRTTLEYYDKGLEIAEAANVTRLYEHAVAFVVPGGIDNLRNFAFEGLPAFEFVSNIGRDLAVDVATCKAGRFVSKMARTSLQSARQARMASRSGQNNGRGQYTSVQREWHSMDRATRLNIQRQFVENKVLTRQWLRPTHRIGGRDAWKDQNGNIYYTKDSQHGDIEVWQVSGRRAYHQGSMEPNDGRFHPELAVPGRKM